MEFIQTINDNKICMIMAGFLGQHIVPHVHSLSQVDSIFIFCGNNKRHEQWTEDWPKIKGVFTEIASICEALKQAAYQCEQNAMSLTFMPPNKKLDQLDPSFMYTRILKDILVSMDFEEKHIKEYTDYCRDMFSDNEEELIHVEKLERQYSNKTPIWWYTYQCFLYPMLNRALRLLDGDIIIRMAFFIRDLHQHIEQLHTEQFGAQYSPASFTVYRGQGLSKNDFEQMSKTKDGLISFNNFLSTSKKREVSYFDTEDEVLFSMHTVFRICDIRPMIESHHLYEVILTLTSDDDEDLRALTDSIRDEISSCEGGWRPLSFMLEKIGQYDKAEEVYQAVLEQVTYELAKGSLYHALGRIKFGQGKYHEAIMFHEKAINIYQANFSPTSLSLFAIYNNIGMAYDAMGEYSTALSYFERAVVIRQQSLCSDHPDLANCYNNIGNVYYRMGNYSEALLSHEKALIIRQQSLPPNHPHLAMCYNDIGLVYESMNNYMKAHTCFECATEIGQHSLPSNHPDLLKYRKQLERMRAQL